MHSRSTSWDKIIMGERDSYNQPTRHPVTFLLYIHQPVITSKMRQYFFYCVLIYFTPSWNIIFSDWFNCKLYICKRFRNLSLLSISQAKFPFVLLVLVFIFDSMASSTSNIHDRLGLPLFLRRIVFSAIGSISFSTLIFLLNSYTC